MDNFTVFFYHLISLKELMNIDGFIIFMFYFSSSLYNSCSRLTSSSHFLLSKAYAKLSPMLAIDRGIYKLIWESNLILLSTYYMDLKGM